MILLVKSSLSGIHDKWKNFGSFYNVTASHKQRAIPHVTLTWLLFTKTSDLITKQVKETNKASFSSCFDSLFEFTFPFTSPTIPDTKCQKLVSVKGHWKIWTLANWVLLSQSLTDDSILMCTFLKQHYVLPGSSFCCIPDYNRDWSTTKQKCIKSSVKQDKSWKHIHICR